MEEKNYCLWCRAEIPLSRKFCSKNCGTKWHYHQNKVILEDKNCVICGDTFTPRNGDQVTCGKDECKKKRHYQRVAEYRQRNKEYAYKKDEGLEEIKPKALISLTSPASRRWARMPWKELTMELDYYGLSYCASQILAEINALPEDFGKKRKRGKKNGCS